MADNKICGECKWHSLGHKYDNVWSSNYRDYWWCSNADSDKYADDTDYTDTCEEWEQRGIE